MIMHGTKPVTEVFIHQTTTRPDWMEGKPVGDKIAEIDSWHKARGWRGIGYHYVIDRDGSVGKGRAETEIGAHVAGHNTGSIGITLVGGHGASMDDPFERNFTPQQDAALRELLDDIKSRTTIKRVRGHCEVANKVCPGFNVQKFLRAQDPPRVSVAQSTTMQASAANAVAGAATIATAVGSLHGNTQLVLVGAGLVMLFATAWVARERLIKWTEGVR